MTQQSPILSTVELAGGTAQLREDGVTINSTALAVELRFGFPPIGRPAFPDPAQPGSADVTVLGPEAVLALVARPLPGLEELVQAALGGRIALVATGDPSQVVPLRLGPAEPVFGPSGEGLGFLLIGAPAERTLYDVAVQAGTVGWQVVAPHAVYYRAQWSDFGLAHISDTHVARRIDGFRPLLRRLGLTEAAERMCNMNDQFRGFVRLANQLHAAGDLDVIVATGDLIDYQFERDDDRAGTGNAGFLRRLLLGTAPGPDWPVVEELRVPIVMAPGNHDYRIRDYDLVFDVNVSQDLYRVRNFSNLALLEREAVAVNNHTYYTGTEVVPNLSPQRALDMVAYDTTLRPYRQALGDHDEPVVRLGKHRLVMVDSAHDVGLPDSVSGALWEGVKIWWGAADEDVRTLVGGSPNCEGVSEDEYAAAVTALEQAPADGLVIVAVHAPLVNPAGGQTPYFLRETARPHQGQQAAWWVARHADEPADQLARAHVDWFARPGESEPAYLKRGDGQDLLDDGVSRGRTDDLVRALTGEDGGRRADVVLAGHTHRHNEISIRRLEDGSIAYFLDYYTGNPSAGYPVDMVRREDIGVTGDPNHPRLHLPTTRTYVEITPDALPDSSPWPMPWDAKHDYVVHVPPYADPLATAADPAAWWERHKPLQLQTGALGLWENDQVSFSGFRLLTVRGDVIQQVHFLPRERLDANGWSMSLADAAAPPAARSHRLLQRSRRFGSPSTAGAPVVVTPGAEHVHSVVYRDTDAFLVELWDTPGDQGMGRLAGRDVAPAAVGEPAAYVDPSGTTVVLYRGDDAHIHSLYWSGQAAAGHDALSASSGAIEAAGDPSGYALAGINHVFYRSPDSHIEELWWEGTGEVSHGHITGYCGEPLAAGDPHGYPVTTSNQNIVVYRGVDGHVHSLYWSDGPTGHDNLSGYVGSPLAAGDPVGYHLPHLDAHQVVYRGVDGHLHEIRWVGVEPAQVWDLVAAAGAPAAASEPSCWYAAATSLKHVSYVGVDGHVHDLAWAPGSGALVWTDLTFVALAPPASPHRPAGYTVPGSASAHVVFRGADGQVHEIRWG